MSLLSLLLIIACIGVVTYCIIKWFPMPPAFKNIVLIVAVVTCGLLALNAFGVIDAMRGVQVPKVR